MSRRVSKRVPAGPDKPVWWVEVEERTFGACAFAVSKRGTMLDYRAFRVWRPTEEWARRVAHRRIRRRVASEALRRARRENARVYPV